MLIFAYLASVVAEFEQFCNFLPSESCKTYLGPVLPSGSRNGQLSNSNYTIRVEYSFQGAITFSRTTLIRKAFVRMALSRL
jgi:hypothetical protein